MAKKKTFKPMPEAEPPGAIVPEDEVARRGQATPAALEVKKQDKPDLITELLKVEGMSKELAEHMAKHGIPGDSFTVQTFYRVSALTADAVIKVFEEAK